MMLTKKLTITYSNISIGQDGSTGMVVLLAPTGALIVIDAIDVTRVTLSCLNILI